ncbi:MAG: hypothetical protein N2C14_18960, partial [Planctomycetales bacterium]
LHPQTQEAMLAVVREFTRRYGRLASFEGIAVELSAEGYARLPGTDWTLDDWTVARFEQETQVRFQGAGPNRFAARRTELETDDALRQQWLDWRCEQVKNFYARVQDEVIRAKPDARLYLLTSNMFDNLDAQLQLRRQLLQGSPAPEAFQSAGIDPKLYHGAKSPVLLRPRRLASPQALGDSNGLGREFNRTPDVDKLFRDSGFLGAQCYQAARSRSSSSFDARGPWKTSRLQMLDQAVPSGAANSRRLAQALAAFDADLICDGGDLLALSENPESREFLNIYRALPAARFEDLKLPTQPVVARIHRDAKSATLYFVNDSPWPVTLRMLLRTPRETVAEAVGGTEIPSLRNGADGARWDVPLRPHQLLAARFSDPKIRVLKAAVVSPPELPAKLKQQIERLSSRIAALRPLNKSRPQGSPQVIWNLQDVLPNPGFEKAGSGPNEAPGWTLRLPVGAEAEIDATTRRGGRNSLRLRSIGPKAVLETPAFHSSETGTFLMLVWMRIADGAKQPAMQLSLEASQEG